MNRIDSNRTRISLEVLAGPRLSGRITRNLAKIIYVHSVTQDIREDPLVVEPGAFARGVRYENDLPAHDRGNHRKGLLRTNRSSRKRC